MTRYHATPEGNIAFSAEEETARDAEEKTWSDEAAVRAFVTLRQERDAKLAKSDYMGNSDVTMSTAWKTYRKALRDLPATLNDTTVLETITWPTEPS
jgi:hypothetical protein